MLTRILVSLAGPPALPPGRLPQPPAQRRAREGADPRLCSLALRWRPPRDRRRPRPRPQIRPPVPRLPTTRTIPIRPLRHPVINVINVVVVVIIIIIITGTPKYKVARGAPPGALHRRRDHPPPAPPDALQVPDQALRPHRRQVRPQPPRSPLPGAHTGQGARHRHRLPKDRLHDQGQGPARRPGRRRPGVVIPTATLEEEGVGSVLLHALEDDGRTDRARGGRRRRVA